MEFEFYPCNDRERDILAALRGEILEAYKRRRNSGSTVSEAFSDCRDMVSRQLTRARIYHSRGVANHQPRMRERSRLREASEEWERVKNIG